MEVADRLSNLLDNIGRCLLIKFFVWHFVLDRVEIAPGGVLDDQINVGFVVKVAIKFQNIGVVEVWLNFDLSKNLLLGGLGLEVGFLDHLYGANEIGPFVSVGIGEKSIREKITPRGRQFHIALDLNSYQD